MIRLILREVDCEAAAGAGAPIEQHWQTLDIEHPDLEKWLTEKRGGYITRSIQGAEVLTTAAQENHQ